MEWKIPLFKIYWDNDDIEMVTSSVKRGMFWAAGPNIEKLEGVLAEYIGRKYCITFNSGTSALHAVLMAYGISKGDEVIVPSFTFIATANAPKFVAAKPVFADIEETTYGLDPEDVKRKITSKTRAIMPIHYGGSACRIDELRKIAKTNNLLLIEDAAESFGAKWDGEKVGNFGDAAMFSLCQTKVFTSGEGGCIVTDSKELAEKLKLIRSHGRAETANYFSSTEFMDYVTLGYNFRMPDIIAALGISQLKKVDHLIEMRRNNSEYLTSLLKDIKEIIIPQFPREVFHVYQEYAIKVKNAASRDKLRSYLSSKGILTRVSFFPVHMTHYYKNVLKYKVKLPITEDVSSRALTLPMYPSLTKEEMDFMAAQIHEFFKGVA